MDINEHWTAAESHLAVYAKACATANTDPDKVAGVHLRLAHAHYAAVQAAALFAQHYPAAYDSALRAGGPDAAAEVARTYPGSPGSEPAAMHAKAAAGDVIDRARRPTGWIGWAWSEDTVRRLHGMVQRRLTIEMFGVWYAPAVLDGEGHPTRVDEASTVDLTDKAARVVAPTVRPAPEPFDGEDVERFGPGDPDTMSDRGWTEQGNRMVFRSAYLAALEHGLTRAAAEAVLRNVCIAVERDTRARDAIDRAT